MKLNKTILLTGGTGYLGSSLLSRLVRENYDVVLLKRSSSNTHRITDCLSKIRYYDIDYTNLEKVFQNNRIDLLIHCATNYGRKEIDPIALLEANLILPLKLLQLGKKYAVRCFINTDTILDKRVSYYSLSKSQFKEWLDIYSSDMHCVNIALEHFYGPFDDESKFVTHIVRSILANVEKLDLTRGEQKRDFIYIDDVVDAFLKIIKHSESLDKGYSNYEIGTNQAITINDFVTLVKRLSNNKNTYLNFGALPYRENEIMESHVNISSIVKLGWKPAVSLEEGLLKTIDSERELKKA